ncbi:hypothetical protein BDZ89DRAFT_1054061 [Hymenopellis radicata]|nr:hypothetical protein BDZ89DRAFT_1054061 [Hymenopellis radicata]
MADYNQIQFNNGDREGLSRHRIRTSAGCLHERLTVGASQALVVFMAIYRNCKRKGHKRTSDGDRYRRKKHRKKWPWKGEKVHSRESGGGCRLNVATRVQDGPNSRPTLELMHANLFKAMDIRILRQLSAHSHLYEKKGRRTMVSIPVYPSQQNSRESQVKNCGLHSVAPEPPSLKDSTGPVSQRTFLPAIIIMSKRGASLKTAYPLFSLIVPAPIDDPALSQGRVRSAPHVAGQWASHVYVSLKLSGRSSLYTLLNEVIHTARYDVPTLNDFWEVAEKAASVMGDQILLICSRLVKTEYQNFWGRRVGKRICWVRMSGGTLGKRHALAVIIRWLEGLHHMGVPYKV